MGVRAWHAENLWCASCSHPDALEERGLPISQLDKYLASALHILNTTSMQPIKTFHLELTKVDSEYPGYVLFSPTVVDLDSSGSDLEIVLGTSAGQLHVINWAGGYKEGFPIPTDSVSGQVCFVLSPETFKRN